MKVVNATEGIFKELQDAISDSDKNIKVVLVGGCSRSGKSTFVAEIQTILKLNGIATEVLSLDHWLVSVEKRKENSTVIERYEIPRIIESIDKLLKQEIIFPPSYSPGSRRRIAEKGERGICINHGVLFIEGTIALGIEKLRTLADYRIFVDLPDVIRKERLMQFYTGIKRMTGEDASKIIQEREEEEVIFIKSTKHFSTIIYNSHP